MAQLGKLYLALFKFLCVKQWTVLALLNQGWGVLGVEVGYLVVVVVCIRNGTTQNIVTK
jgi:hypothetical protein